MYNLLVVSLFCVIGGSLGQIVQNGQCNPDISLEADFNSERFSGKWYEIARTDNPEGGDCSSIEFTPVGQAVTVTHTTVRENFFAEYQGQASVAPGTARVELNLPQISSNPIKFWVLRTDYDNFALAHGCENLGNTQRQVYIWQLGRTPSPPTEMMQAALNNIMTTNFNITFPDLRTVSHSDDACYILPKIEAGQPVILPGQCDPNIKGVANFQATEFLGVWHQIQSYYSSNAGGTCNRAQYSDGGNVVNVVNSQVQRATLFTLSGNATVISNDGSGQLNVVLEVLPGVLEESELLVLGTDYKQWAVTYTCVDLANNLKQVFSWVSSRTRVLPPAAREQVNQVINSLIDLNDQYYQTTDQSDESCFYVPESQMPGEPVVFGGQCDMNINVVSNFSAVDYTGLWHEIERYPTPFQFGACNNAYYTLVDGVVDVFNTQVLDEQLLTINGVAVPVADGKLVVSFPVEGTSMTTETDYWVLSTDYGNYSLVYSCRNINDYQQQVTFWKLSRTKQLIPEAITAINDVMNSLTILNQQHFMPTDQSPQGCFYYPEPQPDVPVVFPGTCENNIQVVPDFNLNLFQGTWYEVEAYPKDPQEGECISHEFSAGTGTAALTFLSSYVEDQLLGNSNGQLTFYPGDTGGRFTLSFTSNGTTISFPYYVVATDYSDYAVVYSCVNDGTDFRRVFAWKLSRTKQLSDSAKTAVSNFFANANTSVVLSNIYFEEIDQSDYACFYFPEIAPGAPVVLPGQCEDLPVMANLNVSAYMGRWFLIESYPANNQIGQCNQANYTLNDGGTIGVYNNEVANQILRQAYGVATVLPNGKLSVLFPNTDIPFELTILGTDYANYSVVYGCVDVGNSQRRVQSWKFSRTSELSPESIAAINDITGNITVLNDRYYQPVDQSDDACFYYPPVGAGPMIFRGQCNQSIPVVTDFDAVAYMNLWHDIESYPVPFQNGGCPNAFYTLDTVLGRVEVFNTQVVSEATLDTILGYATLVPSTDGSAKLEVSFPSLQNNSTTPYWVLSTDYINYALVYSCVDISDEYRTVTSWKLSRTKELNATAVAAINDVVATIPVLDDRYYIKRDHSREGCFYFPDPEPGVPVKFPGQCNESISAVNDFSLSLFSGIWHEIEAYPKDQQTGECVNHQFTVNGNTFNLQSNSVMAQSLGVTDGVVTLANPDVAKMSISIVSNGTNIQIPYWIIQTDYENYALAYSCVNIDDDYRGVYSWKLSRTKELRDADRIAIDTAIADIDVLGNQYYEKINQTDEACFYYPEPTGRPVVFPGQCGNIQAKPNFNAEDYLGVWRTIESYPSDFQLGTCGDAEYSPGNGVVNVYNTEVINESLSTINGTAVAATDGTGKLYVTFPTAPAVSEYLILETDYKTYSIVYSCTNNANGDQRTVYSWKLSRTNVLPSDAQSAIAAVVNSIDVLDERYYQLEDRTADACFYFPEADGSAVIFRGQCDLTIPVQPNFSAADYTGTWYNIESYPAPFQGGTCRTHNYDLLGGVVEYTQVIDRELDVQIGTAEVVDNAKLAVTFNVNGQVSTTNYWILATDYNSFSFVYSCHNIDPYYKEVNSFKLSRNKTLTTAAENTINNVINNVKVLEQRYFVEEKQDEDNCFVYPEIKDGNVILEGTCVPDNQVPVMTNFNANQFSGVWHEVERFPSDLQKGECSATNFAFAQNTYTMTNTIVDNEAQSSNDITGTVATNGRGVITINNAGVPFESLYILNTNYNDYALVYACRNLPNDTKQIYSWKLARSRKGFSPAAETILNDLVAQNDDLAPKYYFNTEQTSSACFHYPEYDVLPEKIELEGHCDETIRGVANFNATAYLELWKEIERYPEPNQFGTCDRAFYSLGEGNVLVRNTQVIGNSQLEQTGFATVASTDGSGLLSIDFNVNGVEVNANYYILATDYEDYALVYSCRNTYDVHGYEKRIVSSWKLSRTDTLSRQAEAEISRVIGQTEGLSERFYQKTSQSAEDCFYIPEVDVNSAPLFRGTCGTTSGVANFNINRFVGWWNELERYPVDNNVGQCINSQYSSAGTSFQVVDTAVSGGNGIIVTGTVTANANGVLTKVLSTGETQEIVVLETDYDNYALLYSCVDVTVNGEPYRKVWSAKHSRTRDPASVKVPAIDEIITRNSVLYDQFYQTVDQSNQACFYYPEVQGQRVILPGQCDDSIPVVQNFDVEAYGGTWYQIERYPQVHENAISTCIGARYLLEGDVVRVLNWEVIDGELSTIEGNATLSSTDGSAKLSVELPIVGTELTVTSPLYVLATDYESYSIAYSCSNYGPFQRSIGAWKLSRERTMPVQGTTAINDVISRREELNQNYFLSVQHNDECPEPSSSVLVKSSVVVMLVCLLVQLFY